MMQPAEQSKYWVDNLSPFLFCFWDSVGIRYYGLAYVLGFVIGALLLRLYWRLGRSSIGLEAQTDFITAIIICRTSQGRSCLRTTAGRLRLNHHVFSI
jgi:prolipoprotein diacylglyceryltransferase